MAEKKFTNAEIEAIMARNAELEARAAENKEKKYWIVTKLVDYKIQALGVIDEDDEPEFMELGKWTCVSANREDMFQLARKTKGLLCLATGVPSPLKAQQFEAAMKQLAEGLNAQLPDGFDN